MLTVDSLLNQLPHFLLTKGCEARAVPNTWSPVPAGRYAVCTHWDVCKCVVSKWMSRGNAGTVSPSFFYPSEQTWASMQSPCGRYSVDTSAVTLMLPIACPGQSCTSCSLCLESFSPARGWAASHLSDLGFECSLLAGAFPDLHVQTGSHPRI